MGKGRGTGFRKKTEELRVGDGCRKNPGDAGIGGNWGPLDRER